MTIHFNLEPAKPDLIVLPFKATRIGLGTALTLEETLTLLAELGSAQVRIERSYPGAPDAIGWSIFRRTPQTYLYENEPLFRFERGARRHIRKAYAIHYELTNEDVMTYSHLHL